MSAASSVQSPATTIGIVDLPMARPSQILRSLTTAHWCRRHIRLTDAAPGIQYCAIGRLADEGGFDWSSWDQGNDEHSNAAAFVRQTYGLKTNQVKALMYRNDVDDLDAVIEFLERRGL